jgi:U3 small nucleolar RNA-associated protein 18
MNSAVRSLSWTGAGANLMTLAADSSVYVWDVGERRCVSRWQDHGGFGSVLMSADESARYLAVGSNTGLVNVYDQHAIGSALPTSGRLATPKPLKTFGNLTTSISAQCFNHDSQLLAIASKEKKDQMRMVLFPSHLCLRADYI